MSGEFAGGLFVGAMAGGWSVFMFALWLFDKPRDCTKEGHEFVGYEAGRHCLHCGAKP